MKAYATEELELDEIARTIDEPLPEGKNRDAARLQQLGKEDLLNRVLTKSMGLFGLASTTSISWQNQVLLASLALSNGGRAGFVWSSMVVFVFMTAVYQGFREKAAIYPVAAGQYFWILKTAPKSSARFLGFISGWIVVWAWQAFQTAGVVLIGTFVASLAYMCTGFSANWFAPTMSIGTAFLVYAVNRFFIRTLAKLEPYFFWGHLASAVIFFIVTPVLQSQIGRPLASPSDIFLSFENHNGWISSGGAALLSANVGFSSAIGYDSVAHMSQEVERPDTHVPAALLVSNIVNFTLSWLASIITSLCTPDVGAYLESALALSTPNGAFLEIFLHATGSRVGATLLSLPIILTIFVSCCNAVACASRQLWAFAADGGFPFSRWLFQRDMIDKPKEKRLPGNAILVSMICPVSLPLIGIGSTAALNAIISLVVGCLLSSYLLVCIASLCFRLQGHRFPKTPFAMPPGLGMFLDALSIPFLIAGIVIAMFPAAPQPSAKDMNYAVLLWASCIISGTIYWYLEARRSFVRVKDTTTSVGE